MTAKTAGEYADLIMASIDADIRDGFPWGERMPPDVASFSKLHDYCDANCYLIDAAVPWSDEDAGGLELATAVLDEVDRRLAARAPGIRQHMAQVVTHNLGWYVADSDETTSREHDEVRLIADAFTDPDCTAAYCDTQEWSAEQMAGFMREWFTDAEAWLLRNLPERTAR